MTPEDLIANLPPLGVVLREWLYANETFDAAALAVAKVVVEHMAPLLAKVEAERDTLTRQIERRAEGQDPMTQALRAERDAALERLRELEKQEPAAYMWQHPETGFTGFIEHAPLNELVHWEHMNKPRKIVAPLYAAPHPRSEE